MQNITIISVCNSVDIDKNFNEITQTENNKFVFLNNDNNENNVNNVNTNNYKLHHKYISNYEIKNILNSDEYIFIKLFPQMAQDKWIEYAKTKGYKKIFKKQVKYTPYVAYEKI